MRILSRHFQTSITKQIRNPAKLVKVNINKSTSSKFLHITLASWNVHSLNKKSASICDFIIPKRLDILTITETWLTGDSRNNNTVAEILNTLKYFDFVI